MALSRKFLSALDIEGDKVDEIISAHTDTVEALKTERDEARAEADKYKAEATKVPGLQKELESLKEAAEKDGGNVWKTKYEALKEEKDAIKAEFDEFKTATSAKELKAAKEKAYRDLLTKAGISEKRIDSVLKVTNLDSLDLDDSGAIKDSDKVSENIKTEWADFITTSETRGANTATPPMDGHGGSNSQGSRAAEIAKRYHTNLYGSTKEES